VTIEHNLVNEYVINNYYLEEIVKIALIKVI